MQSGREVKEKEISQRTLIVPEFWVPRSNGTNLFCKMELSLVSAGASLRS